MTPLYRHIQLRLLSAPLHSVLADYCALPIQPRLLQTLMPLQQQIHLPAQNQNTYSLEHFHEFVQHLLL